MITNWSRAPDRTCLEQVPRDGDALEMRHRHADARHEAVGDEEGVHVGGEVAADEADDGDEGADEAGQPHAELVLEVEPCWRQHHHRHDLEGAESRCWGKPRHQNIR